MKNLSGDYRGLTKDGKWVYGYLVEFEDMSIIFECGESIIISKASYKPCSHIPSDFWVEVIPETVGRRVGCKDKHGEEMYVGDRYKWYQPLVKNGKQIRKERIAVVIDEIPELFYLSNRTENDWGGVEIIGNVHEKSGLLEK